MKVVILCGGEGTRMKEETEFKPKPLVEVGGKPILWHIMKIYSYYGYNDFVLALGYKGSMIKDYFLNWRANVNDFTLETHSGGLSYHKNGHDDFKITFADTGLKSPTGERLRLLADYIDGEDFMLTYGDGVADINIQKLVEFHKSQNTIGTITGARPMIKYGIVEHDTHTNKVTGFRQHLISSEFGQQKENDFIINGGFMVFKKEFLNLVESQTMVEEAFVPLAKMGQLSLYNLPGKWKAMDTYKEVEEMNRQWQNDPFWKVWDSTASAQAPIRPVQSQGSISIQSLSSLSSPIVSPISQVHTTVSNLAGKNVLVTGGTGLVGSHVVERLIQAGARVFCTIRSQDPRSYFFENKFQEKTTLVYCDINDGSRVFDVVTKYEIQYIFHLAAQPIVATSFINPEETFTTNIVGTINILEAARRASGILGVVVASSDKAYGKDCIDADEDKPLAGDHPYDVSKSAADLIAQTYFKTYGLPVVVTRFGNIYGPGDLNLNRLVPGIMKSILKGEVLPIRSDGMFVRDYVYVKDVVEGYMLAAEKISQSKGQAFNFSTGYNFSVLDLISTISRVVGTECKYTIKNNQVNEIPFQSLNYQKAERMLGYKPLYTLEQGIVETYEWYKKFFKK